MRTLGKALVTPALLVAVIFVQPERSAWARGSVRPRSGTGRLSRRALQLRLRRLVRRPIAKQGIFGIYIKRLGGRVLFSRRGRQRLHPASCVKIITAATALRKFGADYRFDTVIRGRIKGHGLVGPLYLRGQGDPTLTRDDLKRFAAQIRQRGVKEIPQGIVVDDYYFGGKRFPPGFGRPSSSAYMTPTGAVSLDGNTVEVVVTATAPGKKAEVALVPPSDYVTFKRAVKTGTRTRLWAYASRVGKQLKVFVRGTIKSGSAPERRWVRVLDPARYAGESLKRALLRQSVQVGKVRRGRSGKAPLILRHQSKKLAEIVRHMNTTSNNFYAEQLLKALGARVYGAPGTTAKGIKATRGLMQRAGVRSRAYRLANGSVLFGTTRVAPVHFVKLLERIRTLPWLYKALRNSLPVAGVNGTLAKRMGGTPAGGRVRAKTGTFNKVSCLSGYVDGPAGKKPIVFAILHNGFTVTHARARKIQDKIMVLLARYQLGR